MAVTYNGGPFDGEEHPEPPVAPWVERVVGLLDVTPEGVLTPIRQVSVTARYHWEGGRLDFEGLRATYRVVDL